MPAPRSSSLLPNRPASAGEYSSVVRLAALVAELRPLPKSEVLAARRTDRTGLPVRRTLIWVRVTRTVMGLRSPNQEQPGLPR